MPGEAGGRGRRARRRAPASRAPVGPWAGWVVFTLVMSAVVLLAVGVPGASVAWLLLGGAVVGGVLLAAVVLSPPAPLPGSSPSTDQPGRTEGDRSDP